jgi:hypothetical protein
LGFELAPADDGWGRTNARDLRVVLGDAAATRTIVDFGIQVDCHDIAPHPIPLDLEAKTTGTPLLSVHCGSGLGESETHVLPRSDHVLLLRTGRRARRNDTELFDFAKERVTLGPVTAKPLVVVPPLAASAPTDARTLRLEWRGGTRVHTLAGEHVGTDVDPDQPTAEPTLVLSLRGALTRDLQFGVLGGCWTAAPQTRKTAFFTPDALFALDCYGTRQGNTHISIARRQDQLVVLISTSEENDPTPQPIRVVRTLPLAKDVVIEAPPNVKLP